MSKERVCAEVRRWLVKHECRHWIVAFSGGPDSLALAWASSRLRKPLGLTTTLAHLDHGLDPESAERAERARELAAALGLNIVISRANPREGSSSLEGWARDQRYRFLAKVARQARAPWIATAHHADDQAETLLLRLLFGSGLAGLAGIKPTHGQIVRPLLRVRRSHIEATIQDAGLSPIFDPTNQNLDRPRNRIRRGVLPEWNQGDPLLVERLGRFAQTVARTTARLDRRFGDLLELSSTPGLGASASLLKLKELPSELAPHALSALDRMAGRSLPTSRSARYELMRQITAGDRIGCDAGNAWRWHADSRRLRLLPPQKPTPLFTYTVSVPGSVTVTELETRLRIASAPPGRPASPKRADRLLARLPSDDRCRIEIRNRRPGDRLRPAGRSREKRLKEILIDHHVPREMRDRLPLLVVNDRIVWVPGVTYDETFLARPDEPAWLVELRPVTGSPRDSNDERGSTP